MPFPPPLPRPRRARRMVPRVAGAMERRQGLVFGEVADEYDDVRPGYPAVLARAVVEYARDPAWFVEVGAGTGKPRRRSCRTGGRSRAWSPIRRWRPCCGP